MKITNIWATPVRVDTTRTSAWALGQGRSIARTIIEIETDEGVLGIGEAPRGDTAEIINTVFKERLVGISVDDIRKARALCLPRDRDFGLMDDVRARMAFGGVNLAMWDLVGKKRGAPVYRLLGGPVRDKAPFAAYAYNVDLADGYEEMEVPRVMADIATTMLADTGARMFEYKVGRHSLDCEIEIVHAVRAAIGPNIDLCIDANMSMNIFEARRFLNNISKARIACFEEPVPTLGDMQRLHDEFGIMISSHCAQIETIKHYPGVEGVVADYHAEEGLDRCLVIANQCRSQGKQVWLHTYQECGVSWAGRVHFGMACPEAARPGQALTYWVKEPLIEDMNRWRIKDGGVTPPDIPGLGVKLDRDAFARAAEAYHKLGDTGYLSYKRESLR
jgi:glucarate dehydratase